MTGFSDRVQSAVGATYRIEKELGGGGMSRVFLAEETGLERKVVVKVLPPEMAAGVNAERFRREILLAAKLQHPHIVPLLTAGAKDDLLFYVMPFIQGESLRTRLAREGELPVGQAARILRDVADALAYAHRQGVVHRDIKPDNVMLADGHAVVTDFGVAKAVASSTGESSLTSLGVALGTPAYMSPEQAAADPHVDHRADIYALGAMAYEMLTGRPPFTASSPQSVLVAHVTQAPDHVSEHRATVPPALAAAVMRCLEKKPADRFQQAEELVPVFDSLLTPSGGMTPTGTQPVPVVDYGARARRAAPLRVGAVFALAGIGVAAIVYGLMRALGLPSWVFGAGVLLLLAGLPVTLLTGAQERKRALASATGMHVVTPTGMKKLFTWRRALWSGGAAFGGLAVVAGGFMTLRTLGVGPFGTLVSSGKLADRAKILVAEFTNGSTDPTLGRSLTEAFRIDLSQSPVVRVLTADQVGAVLTRMERPESTAVTPDVAREVAQRQGIPAIIVGDISPVGQGFVLSARVLATGDGSELAADRETAENETGLLAALSRLSSRVRERIGESYRSLRDTKPLEEVTTSSLEALRLYTRASQTELAGDERGAADLYRQATLADTGFAMAYRKLGVMLHNVLAPRSEVEAASTAAFRHSDRLPPVERNLAAAWYWYVVMNDAQRTIDAYRAVLAINPDHDVGLNNLAVEMLDLGRWAAAESLEAHALAANDSAVFQNWLGLAFAQYQQGRADSARRTLAVFRRRLPSVYNAVGALGMYFYAQGAWDSAAAVARQLAAGWPGVRYAQRTANDILTSVSAVQGRLAEAAAAGARQERAEAQLGDSGTALDYGLRPAFQQALIAGRGPAALQTLDAALRRYPLDRIAAANRPWLRLVEVNYAGGRADQVRALMDRWTRELPAGRRATNYGVGLALALAVEHRDDQARAALEAVQDSLNCNACVEPWIARSWDAQGVPDSALAHLERYLSAPDIGRWNWDPAFRPWVLLRAGDLATQLGKPQLAVQRYTQFVDLWRNADPDLQPIVRDVRAKLARLGGGSR